MKPPSEIFKSLKMWQPEFHNYLLEAMGTWRSGRKSCGGMCRRQQSASKAEHRWHGQHLSISVFFSSERECHWNRRRHTSFGIPSRLFKDFEKISERMFILEQRWREPFPVLLASQGIQLSADSSRS